jgi:hypothetical protein
MFQNSQDDEYLQICIQRIKEEKNLAWVDQFLDIIYDYTCYGENIRLNDIGCNVGQFYKGLKNRFPHINYHGYDIENIYLHNARNFFPELTNSIFQLDITKEKPRECNISVISATLEHLEYKSPGLENILETTKDLCILRTFLGETSKKAIFKKEKAKMHYFINQFSFLEILDAFDKFKFQTEIIRDKNTDSLPKYIGQGIVRTQYIIVGKKENKLF